VFSIGATNQGRRVGLHVQLVLVVPSWAVWIYSRLSSIREDRLHAGQWGRRPPSGFLAHARRLTGKGRPWLPIPSPGAEMAVSCGSAAPRSWPSGPLSSKSLLLRRTISWRLCHLCHLCHLTSPTRCLVPLSFCTSLPCLFVRLSVCLSVFCACSSFKSFNLCEFHRRSLHQRPVSLSLRLLDPRFFSHHS
jgi:hypothetical protein